MPRFLPPPRHQSTRKILSTHCSPGEEISGESWQSDPGGSVEDSQESDEQEEDPPEPEDEEEFLVEEVVAQYTEEVRPVQASSQGAYLDVAGNFGGEEFTHWVVEGVAVGSFPVVGDVLQDLHAVVPELVVEDPVGDGHGGEDCEEVDSLPECKLLVISVVFPPGSELNEVLSDHLRPRVSFSLFPPHPGRSGTVGATEC